MRFTLTIDIGPNAVNNAEDLATLILTWQHPASDPNSDIETSPRKISAMVR